MNDNWKHFFSYIYPNQTLECHNYTLMFHSVRNNPTDRYQISQQNFAEILNLTIDLKPNIEVCFDDGLEDIYKNTREIVRDFRIKPTMFLSTRLIGSPGYLSNKQVDVLLSEGWIMGGHGHDHIPLGKLDNSDCKLQLIKSYQVLNNIVGKNCKIPMSLPFGSYNSYTIMQAKKAGFSTCYNSILGGWDDDDFFRKRIEIWKSDNLKTITRKLHGKYNFLGKKL